MTIFKRPKLVDEKNRAWSFYCTKCKKWQMSLEHGYSSEFAPSGLYLECPDCGHREAVPYPISETIKDFYFFIKDILQGRTKGR